MYTINAHGASLLSKKSYKSSFGCETLLMETALVSSLKARFLSSPVHFFTYAHFCFRSRRILFSGFTQVISSPSKRHEFLPEASRNHCASLLRLMTATRSCLR
jgi:hypothetical protein